MIHETSFFQSLAAGSIAVLLAFSSAPAFANTAARCNADYAANRVAIMASGQTKKAYVAACRADTTAAPPASSPPATTAAPAAWPARRRWRRRLGRVRRSRRPAVDGICCANSGACVARSPHKKPMAMAIRRKDITRVLWRSASIGRAVRLVGFPIELRSRYCLGVGARWIRPSEGASTPSASVAVPYLATRASLK
jgi:hypothetical protein